MTQTQFRIQSTDVILIDYELGKGKLIISHDGDAGYNFSYYWGAMGEGYDLKKFILRINEGYFVGKLIPYREYEEFSGKLTVRCIRRELKDWIPWYKGMEGQKWLRERLRELEACESADVFYYEMQDIAKDAKYEDFDGYENDISSFLGDEPHLFICNQYTQKAKWLEQFLPKLKKHLKSLS